MKKVIIFSLTYYPRFIGGDGVAIKEITDRIDPHDIEFHMVTLRLDSTLPKVEKIGNVLIHRIGFARKNPSARDVKRFPLHFNKLLFQFLAPLKARKLHKKNRYNVAWAMMAHSAGVPTVLFKMMFPQVHYLLTLQEGDSPEHIERVMRPLWPLFTRAFTKADMVQVISNFLGEWARRRGFKGPLEVIPNGVDAEHFAKAQDHFAIRKALDIREDETVLVTSSRLVHKNAIDTIVHAIALLPRAHCLVLGVGPDEHELKALTRHLGVEDRVHFAGHVSHEQLPAYLQASTIFIRPSRSEGFGNSFVEAFAAGIPVIATQEGGIADFLFDARRNPDKPTTGWAVDKDNAEQIRDAVENILLQDPAETKQVLENARKLAFEKYDWDIIAREMREKVFAKL